MVTFEEARQILAQDERVGRPGYRPPLPPTLAMIRDISEANAVKVCNVGPWEHRLERPSMSVVVPAYKPDQDAAHKGYAESKPFPGIHQFAKQISDGEDVAYTWCQDEGRAALRDLIGIGPGMPMNRSLVHRGVFVPAGPVPTPEEIKTAKHGITIGGGFISFEMADLLNLAKIETTLILRESYFWEPILDEASGLMIEKALTSAGIKIIKNAEVVMVNGGIVNGSTNNPGPELESDRKENSPAIVSNNDSNTQSPEPITTPGFDSLKPVNTTNQIQGPITSVVVKQTKPDLKEIEIPCEMIIAGIGVTNPTGWLADSGVKTNHGIVSNEFMETSAPDIYTAGDIAEYKDLLLEENVQMGNWVNAREQGRVAGLNMTGSHEAFKFVSFYTTQGCGVNIAFVGDVAPGPDRTVITRGSPEINSYGRIIVVNNEIEGATLINRSAEMTTISKLIEKNMDVSKLHKELGDPNFDLKKLI